MVDVYVQCKKLDTLGIGIDFRDVKAAVRELLGELDHTELNALPPFHDENPSSENVARYLYHELGRKLNLPGVRVSKVRVSETPTAGVLYWED
jgi:6-pyruvoyltetrahydropterin/6-carboxytetrahydropterin synthase